MSTTLRIVLLIGIILYFLILVFLLKKNRLRLRYTLLWMFMGLFFLLLVAFPGILELIRDGLGFQDNMNALYVIMIGFILMLLMAATSIISGQADKIKGLAQANALLEARVRELEKERASSAGEEKNEEKA